MDGLEDFWLHGGNHEAGQAIAQVRLDRSAVPIMLALLERNSCEVGFYDNLGEGWVRKDRQELARIERHRSISSNRLYRVGVAFLWSDLSRKNKTGQVWRVGQ